MQLLSLNCNGIRSAARKGFFKWLKRTEHDIVCLQEVRADLSQLPTKESFPRGHHVFWNAARSKAGYSGVAVASRHVPDRVQYGLGWPEFDREGRWLQLDFGRLSVVSLYMPSGSHSEDRHAWKLVCCERLLQHMLQLRAAGRELLICGDYNICHGELDLENWRANRKTSGFRPEERAWLDRVLGAGFRDIFRERYPGQRIYTWWSNRGKAYAKDVGWRLDYALSTPSVAEHFAEAQVYRALRVSDHAPVRFGFAKSLQDLAEG